MLLAPAPGFKVRDPRTRAWIPAAGVEVGPHDFDLHKMLAQGDLVEVSAPAPVPASNAKGA